MALRYFGFASECKRPSGGNWSVRIFDDSFNGAPIDVSDSIDDICFERGVSGENDPFPCFISSAVDITFTFKSSDIYNQFACLEKDQFFLELTTSCPIQDEAADFCGLVHAQLTDANLTCDDCDSGGTLTLTFTDHIRQLEEETYLINGAMQTIADVIDQATQSLLERDCILDIVYEILWTPEGYGGDEPLSVVSINNVCLQSSTSRAITHYDVLKHILELFKATAYVEGGRLYIDQRFEINQAPLIFDSWHDIAPGGKIKTLLPLECIGRRYKIKDFVDELFENGEFNSGLSGWGTIGSGGGANVQQDAMEIGDNAVCLETRVDAGGIQSLNQLAGLSGGISQTIGDFQQIVNGVPSEICFSFTCMAATCDPAGDEVPIDPVLKMPFRIVYQGGAGTQYWTGSSWSAAPATMNLFPGGFDGLNSPREKEFCFPMPGDGTITVEIYQATDCTDLPNPLICFTYFDHFTGGVNYGLDGESVLTTVCCLPGAIPTRNTEYPCFVYGDGPTDTADSSFEFNGSPTTGWVANPGDPVLSINQQAIETCLRHRSSKRTVLCFRMSKKDLPCNATQPSLRTPVLSPDGKVYVATYIKDCLCDDWIDVEYSEVTPDVDVEISCEESSVDFPQGEWPPC